MPAELTGGGIAIAVAVALIAAFIRGLSGFGLALILVPVLALTVTPEQAVVAANALGVVMGLASIRGARAAAERSATSIALLAVVTTPVGLALLAVTPDQVARVVIALAALLAFTVVLRPRRAAVVTAQSADAEPPGQPGPGLIRATGVTSGLLAGFAGIPGPPVIAFYLGRAVAPAAARASVFIVFLATSISACIAALALSIADVTAGWLTILLAPAVLIGNWLGSRAFGRVSPLAWRLCAGGIVAGAALVALLRLI